MDLNLNHYDGQHSYKRSSGLTLEKQLLLSRDREKGAERVKNTVFTQLLGSAPVLPADDATRIVDCVLNWSH